MEVMLYTVTCYCNCQSQPLKSDLVYVLHQRCSVRRTKLPKIWDSAYLKISHWFLLPWS